MPLCREVAPRLENNLPKSDNRRRFDWNDLKFFLAVARHGSSLAAARRLGTSQSTVHRRLNELEKGLGYSLIERRQSGYLLTELGQSVVACARSIEDSFATFERLLNASDKGLSGTVRLTCPETVGYRLMRGGLPDRFNARFPYLRIELVMDDEYLSLAKGQAEIAIRRGAPTEAALVRRKIASVHWAVYASHAYIKKFGSIRSYEDINHHRVAVLKGAMEGHPAARWLRSIAPKAKVVASSVNFPSLILVVKSGVALAPLPTSMGEGDAELARMLGPIPELVDEFYMLMHEDLKRAPRVRAVFDFIVDERKLVSSILSGKPIQS